MSATAHVEHAGGKGHFLRHLGEMTLAMILGMTVLGGIVRAAAAAAGVDYADLRLQLPAVSALMMALNMSAPMAWWMRRRGHGWGYTVEMSAAMLLPVLVLVPALLVGVISAETLSTIQHAVMIPSMMIVMVHRRGELVR